MSGGILKMSAKERERACLVRQAVRGELSQRVCAERLGIGVRQFKRLVRAWRNEGDTGLVSRQRGQPSHRRLSETTRARIEALLREKYPDFGATLAAEKLLELDGIKVSIETVRRIQIGLGLWRPKTRRARRVPTAPAASTVWRTDPDRWQSARLVRGPWSALHADRVH